MGLLKKTALVGIGIASMTKDKIEKLGKQIAKESDLSEKEGREFVDDLIKQSEKTRNKLEKKVEKTVKDTLKKMNIPSRGDLQKLESRIKKLEKSKH